MFHAGVRKPVWFKNDRWEERLLGPERGCEVGRGRTVVSLQITNFYLKSNGKLLEELRPKVAAPRDGEKSNSFNSSPF